jgi:NADH-quinone oxidoreductase subunit L
MGGLRTKIPYTFWTMVCAWVAIAGVPPFSGFFSKDAILVAAYEHMPAIFWIGVVTAGITAFYVSRAMFMTFFGEYRGHHHPHESPFVMWGPLAVLGVLSLGGGLMFNIPKFLEALFPAVQEHENPMLMIISVAAGAIGILLAAVIYVWKPASSDAAAGALGPFYRGALNKYYIDEIYNAVIVKPLVGASRLLLWKGVDAGLIDGIVNGVGSRARDVGSLLRRFQSGNIRSYATWVLAGGVAVILVMGLAGGIR